MLDVECFLVYKEVILNLYFKRGFLVSGLLAMLGLLWVAGCAKAPSGAAAGGHAQGANSGLESCDEALGTMMVIEDTSSDWYRTLEHKKLGSTVPVLRLLAQQSNCFVVVERGRGMESMMRERSLANSGELREESNFGKGQMVAADFTLNPSLIFSNQDASGTHGNVGRSLAGGNRGAQLALGLAGSTKTSEASTVLTLIENRSGVQVAAAAGNARNVDFGAMGSVFGSRTGGSLGGYTNTAEGKVISAALTDSFNNMVKAVRNYKMQTVKGGLGTGRGGLKVQQ